MEEALVLLSDGGSPPLAPALQEEIQESLPQLRPQVILDHIKVSTCTAQSTHVPVTPLFTPVDCCMLQLMWFWNSAPPVNATKMASFRCAYDTQLT